MKQTGGVLIVFAGFVALVMGLNGTMDNVWKALWSGAQKPNQQTTPLTAVQPNAPFSTAPSTGSGPSGYGVDYTPQEPFQNVPGSGVRQP